MAVFIFFSGYALHSLDLILRWLGEAVQELHGLTNSIQDAAEENPEFMAAFVLFAESFIAIADLFHSAKDAREGVS